jgi:hypothetical protein
VRCRYAMNGIIVCGGAHRLDYYYSTERSVQWQGSLWYEPTISFRARRGETTAAFRLRVRQRLGFQPPRFAWWRRTRLVPRLRDV